MFMASSVNEIQPYYVFNIGSDEGFVVMSGDDSTRPVLGYSRSGHFDSDSLPLGLKALLQGYASDLTYIQQQNLPERSAYAATASSNRPPIVPLLTSQWNQMYPYNLLCPKFDTDKDNRPTGCVATAVAQVMYYHRWPLGESSAIDGYSFIDDLDYGGDGSERLLPALEPTMFDWNQMSDIYSYCPQPAGPTSSELEVAKLMQYVGYSVQMIYGVNASAAFSEYIASALINNFGYKNTAHIVYRNDYFTQVEWNKVMYDELVAGRPILYSGVTQNMEGHQFVCDGYENGYFHINWGWGGMSDSYFLLEILDPTNQGTGGAGSGMAFSYYQSAVIGVEPPAVTEKLIPASTMFAVGDEGELELVLHNMRQNYVAMEFDLVLPQGIMIAEDEVGGAKVEFESSRSEDASHTVVVEQRPDGIYHFVVQSPTNAVITGKGKVVVRATLQVAPDVALGDYNASISNVRLTANTKAKYRINRCDFVLNIVEKIFTLGDVNHDGQVDYDDVDLVIDALKGVSADNFDVSLAQFAQPQNVLDIWDLMLLLDKIHVNAGDNRHVVPCDVSKLWHDQSFVRSGDYLSYNYRGNGSLKALQMDLSFAEDVSLVDVILDESKADEFCVEWTELAPGRYRIFVFSPRSLNMPSRRNGLVKLRLSAPIYKLDLVEAKAMTSDFQSVFLPSRSFDYPTGIEEISVDEIGEGEVYTITGVRVDVARGALPKGIYIVNGKKVLIR